MKLRAYRYPYVQQDSEEYIIQQLMPIISNLPIRNSWREVTLRDLRRPIGHSLLTSSISQIFIDIITHFSITFKENLSVPDIKDTSNCFVWRQISGTAQDSIWNIQEKQWKKNGNRMCMPNNWYAMFDVSNDYLDIHQWLAQKLKLLSQKVPFAKHVKRSIRFYLIVRAASILLENGKEDD